MNILLTGGAGYIGSHTAVVLVEAGHEVIIFDNFCNSEPSILDALYKILGRPITCIDGDMLDMGLIQAVLIKYEIDAVIHCAGLKSVSESIEKPLLYYSNNVSGTISLLQAMHKTNIKKIVFSSSATVYGNPEYLPIDENHPLRPTNPYGQTKINIEQVLQSLAKADESVWRIISLRYFNPVGAHESGLIGENPKGIPNNLMPYIKRVASGRLSSLRVFGGNYPTPDGTGVRDYIHVVDLAEGHLAALYFLSKNTGFQAINLGTGVGYSVLEVIKEYEKAALRRIPYEVIEPRAGDVPVSFAAVAKSKSLLGWEAKRSIENMCQTSWNQQIRY